MSTNDLMAGYTRYTTADEIGAAATGTGMATIMTPPVMVSILPGSVILPTTTVLEHC